MPDREKVIEVLQKALDNAEIDGMIYAEVRRPVVFDIINLLKGQEAVEPILIREGRNKYYNDYVCPGCDNELNYGQNYCSECGRSVKWE